MLKELITIDRKEYYNDRNKTAIDNYMKQNLIYSLKKSLLDVQSNGKFHHKLKKVNFVEAAFIDHQDTHHTISLQKSRYLQVEEEVDKIFMTRLDRQMKLNND